MNRARHPGFFARFLHTRAIHRLFRRMAMLESLAGTPISREMPDVLGKTLTEAARADPADVLRSLASHADGLTEPEARAALRRAGPNEVEHEKPLPWWQHLWHCYRNPFNLLLTVLAAISWATDDIKAATVITAMVVLSTGLRFWQESRSHAQVQGEQHRHRAAACPGRRPGGSPGNRRQRSRAAPDRGAHPPAGSR